jgi:hypothetical protein
MLRPKSTWLFSSYLQKSRGNPLTTKSAQRMLRAPDLNLSTPYTFGANYRSRFARHIHAMLAYIEPYSFVRPLHPFRTIGRRYVSFLDLVIVAICWLHVSSADLVSASKRWRW